MKKTEEYYLKIIRWAKNKGFKDIRADFEGYEKPSGFTKKEGGVLTPNVSARSYDSKYYFEIAIKTNDDAKVQELISKWKMLSMVAGHKGGGLYLFVPHGNKSFAQKAVTNYSINAKIVSLKDMALPKT